MSALHHDRVRRARRLPVPLPRKPKRPIEPPQRPVLFCWRDAPIRTRADVEAEGTWDEFLDAMAAHEAWSITRLQATHLPRPVFVELVMPSMRPAVVRDYGRRVRAAMERAYEREREDTRRRDAIMAVAERSRPGILARLFGRAA